jgi:hypothetical protein
VKKPLILSCKTLNLCLRCDLKLILEKGEKKTFLCDVGETMVQ